MIRFLAPRTFYAWGANVPMRRDVPVGAVADRITNHPKLDVSALPRVSTRRVAGN